MDGFQNIIIFLFALVVVAAVGILTPFGREVLHNFLMFLQGLQLVYS